MTATTARFATTADSSTEAVRRLATGGEAP
jgi:hypothetical protein